MTTKQVQALPLGVYRIHWKIGGTSVASVGQTYSGKRWLAPANWTCPDQVCLGVVTTTHWRHVKQAVLIVAA